MTDSKRELSPESGYKSSHESGHTVYRNTTLDPQLDPADSPDHPQDHEPDTVATPEGDNEFAPDQPIKPAPDGLQRTPAIDTNKL